MNLQSQAIQPAELTRFVTAALPAAAVANSYLVELRWDPALSQSQQVQEFSTNALHELHHLMGLWGALLRLQSGDQAALSGVGLNLARFLSRRQTTIELANRLPEAIRQDARVQRMIGAINESTAQVQAYWPALTQTLAATGRQSAGTGGTP